MVRKMTPKQKFIAEYIDKNMKFHKMDYGIAYILHIEALYDKAERKWKKIKTKKDKCTFCGGRGYSYVA